MDISLHPGTPEDYDFLWELHCATMHASVGPIWGWDEVRQSGLSQERFLTEGLSIVEADGVAVGALPVERSADGLFLERINIAPAYQSQGIGTKLIHDLLVVSEKCGVPVELRVLRTSRARRLYERLGFAVVVETEERVFMRRTPVTKR